MRRITLILFCIVLIQACTSNFKQKANNNTACQVSEYLHTIAGSSILFGHQDDMAYGVGWGYIPGESDVKRITGSYPAVFGWDIGNIGQATNLEGVPFDSIKSYMVRVYNMGGINVVSWHSQNPITRSDAWTTKDANVAALLPGGEAHALLVHKLDLIADFFEQVKTPGGELVPIIFRPWHEMYGNWFWWGTSTCSDDDFITLFRFTVDYLRKERGLKNLLIAFSPDNNFTTDNDYLRRYPGDDYVDILGLNDYVDFEKNRLDQVVVKLGIVSDVAREKGKIAAFTETGNEKLTIPNWYTSNLLQVLNASEKTRYISYVMVWCNSDTTHFFVPYPGHAQEEDFRNFVSNKMILLLDDLKN